MLRLTRSRFIGTLGVVLLAAGCGSKTDTQPKVAPTAAFVGAPTSIVAGQIVHFTDQSTAGSSSITSWAWDFGDGQSSSAQNPTHTYASATGSPFTVSLTISSADGANTSTRGAYISVVVNTGSIAVSSNVIGAEIWLDGADTGHATASSAYTLTAVAVGSHTVTCTKTNYGFTPQQVSVTSGNTTPVTVPGIPNPGSIAVSSNPSGAEIWIDGIDTGHTTPYTFSNIAVGSHLVTCTLANWSFTPQTVTVTSGNTTSVTVPGTANTGSIAVSSNVTGAEIWLDGSDTGQATGSSAYTLTAVAVGSHTVTCTKTNYSFSPQTVSVTLGNTTPVTVPGTANTGSIAVSSNVTGAEIWLDGSDTGQATGSSAYTLTAVAVGSHTVTCTKTNYSFSPQTVSVTLGNTTPVTVPGTANTGSIAVSSNVTGAEIWLDDSDTGHTTPYTLTGIAAGSHTVTCKLARYTFDTQTVPVAAGGGAATTVTGTPVGKIVTACFLDLFVFQAGGAQHAYACLGNWSACSVTWNNRPSVSSSSLATSTRITDGSTGKQYDQFNLGSNIASQWSNSPATNYGVAIYDGASSYPGAANATVYYSKDQSNPALAPQLIVLWHWADDNTSQKSTFGPYPGETFADQSSPNNNNCSTILLDAGWLGAGEQEITFLVFPVVLN